jgi:pyruvate dehydrogenase E2 component (dihydrolipoamide acetyltransferase)
MPKLLRMPEVAANTTEAVLLSWPVADNVPYQARAVIATVETAKAVVDVEAEADGVILHRLVQEGSEVAVGEPIALIGEVGERVADVAAALATLGHDTAAPGSSAHETGTQEGAAHETVVNETATHEAAAHEIAGPAPAGHRGRIFASPLARRLAREAGLSVVELAGSGPNHRIVRRDVEAAIRSRRVAATSRPPAPFAPAPAPAPTGPAAPSAAVGYSEVPHSRQRRLIAARLTVSKQTAPHFYLRAVATVDALLRLRAELNEARTDRISINDLITKAVGKALLQVPALNVNWGEDALRVFDSADVSVAIATDSGLVAPVVRSVESLSITRLSATVKGFIELARQGRLAQRDLEGGAVTVTNLGSFGVLDFAAIINPPQAAILAVGAVRAQPVARDGELVIAQQLHLTLSVDHRAVDGAQAAQWLAALVNLLEHPVQILS